MTLLKPLLETIIIAIIGGTLFSTLTLPLPWMLGPLTAVMLWQGFTGRTLEWPKRFKSAGLITLGISFGLYFTLETVQAMIPYILPHVILTALIIFISVVNSSFVTRWIAVDRKTSVFGSIPGGMTEMVLLSESLKANPGYVMVFQTIRLLVVLFTVPFIILYGFTGSTGPATQITADTGISFLSANSLWLIVPVLLAVRYQALIPVGIMIIPLLTTAVLNISPVPIPTVPNTLFLAAQLFVGTALGKSIALKDVRQAGKFGFIYGGLALLLVIISFGFGYVLYLITAMDLPTALLSTAPGGVVEMVLTASIVGADAAVVTSLQLARILLILLFVPAVLKWYFAGDKR